MYMHFRVGSFVRHKSTGNVYIIIAAPHHVKIEKTDEPAYIYRSHKGDDNHMWLVRVREEMEDGRFEQVERKDCV